MALSETNRWSTIRIADILTGMGRKVVDELTGSFPDAEPRRAVSRCWTSSAASGRCTSRPGWSSGCIDDEPDVRARAAHALGCIGDPHHAVRADPCAGRSRVARARHGRQGALGRIRNAAAIPPLSRAVGDKEWWVRNNAARALRAMDARGREALEQLLDGPDRFARHQAVLMLQEMGVVDRRVEALAASDDAERERAEAFVRRLIRAGQFDRLRALGADPRAAAPFADALARLLPVVEEVGAMNWVDLVVMLIHGFNAFVLVYFLVLNTTYLLLFLLSLGAVFRFVRRTFFSDYRQIMQSEMTWPISIIVAAHNEEKNIVETVRSLLMVNYSEFEIVVVNDGSTDGTLQRLIRAFDLTPHRQGLQDARLPTQQVRGVYGSLVHPKITVVDKAKGGKSDALNAGINVCRFPLFCSIDADSIIEDNALLRVVKPFMERPEETVAAGGIVRIANGCEVRDGRVTRIELPDQGLPIMQVVEYLRAFLTGRVGWSELRCLLIISGAFGVYKKQEVIEIGGYSLESDTEDLDLVVRLHRHLREQKRKYRVVFVPDPVCWTEAPSTIRVLRRQRNRWHRGLVQTLWDNRGVMFNPRYGSLGLLRLSPRVPVRDARAVRRDPRLRGGDPLLPASASSTWSISCSSSPWRCSTVSSSRWPPCCSRRCRSAAIPAGSI